MSSLGGWGASDVASLADCKGASATRRPFWKSARMPRSRGAHSMPTIRNFLSVPRCQYKRRTPSVERFDAVYSCSDQVTQYPGP